MTTIFWVGQGGTVTTPKSGSFGTAANWSGHVVPGAGDDATFAAGDYAVRVSTAVSLNSIDIGSGVTWRFESNYPNDTLYLAAGGVNRGTIIATAGAIIDTPGTIENDGRMIGGAGVPEFASGTVSNHGAILDGSLQKGFGSISFFNLANAADGRITTPVYGTIFVTGALTNLGLVRVQNGGSLQQQAAGVIGSTTNLVNGVLTGGRWEADTRSFIDLHGPAVTEFGAGTVIRLSGDRSEFMVATVGFGSEVGLDQSLARIDAGATLEALDNRGFGIPSTGALVIDGTMQLGGGTMLGTTVDGTGLLTGFGTVASDIAATGSGASHLTLRALGGTLSLTGDNALGGLLTGAGTLAFASGTDRIDAGATLNAKAVTLAGATVTLDEDLASASAITLQAGSVDLNGHALTLSHVMFAGGALGDSTGAGLLRLVGSREVTKATTIGAGVVNSGTSTVSADLSVTGRVTGTGDFAVSTGVTLHFGDAVGAGQTIDLGAASGTSLVIDKGSLFRATILGFDGQDRIDLTTVGGSSLSLKDGTAPGVIDVLSGTRTVAELTIAGHHASAFSLASDGNGGTTLTQTAA